MNGESESRARAILERVEKGEMGSDAAGREIASEFHDASLEGYAKREALRVSSELTSASEAARAIAKEHDYWQERERQDQRKAGREW